MRRFYVENISGNKAVATQELSAHIARVLRLKPGDKVILFDSGGAEYSALITNASDKNTEFNITGVLKPQILPAVKVSVYQAVIKNDNFSKAVQKCTELGVFEIYPFICERCVKIPSETDKFIKRNKKIAINASEQCKRINPPLIHEIISIENIGGLMMGDLRLLAYEGEKTATLKSELRGKEPRAVDLIVGPEGGFTDAEVSMLKSKGAVPMSLGSNILRSETASPAALAMILYEYGL